MFYAQEYFDYTCNIHWFFDNIFYFSQHLYAMSQPTQPST
jgi:hypothetical protein